MKSENKKQAQAVLSQHSLRQAFLKAFLKKHIKAIYQGNCIQLKHSKHFAFSAF